MPVRIENEVDLNIYISIFLGSCGPHGPVCHNAGICVPSSNSTYTCQCEHPWSGPTCEER